MMFAVYIPVVKQQSPLTMALAQRIVLHLGLPGLPYPGKEHADHTSFPR
jgi:hypothetical protein